MTPTLSTYLILIWLLVTAAYMNTKALRKSAVTGILWLLLTAVSLWPAYKAVARSEVVRDTATHLYSQLKTEVAEEIQGELRPREVLP